MDIEHDHLASEPCLGSGMPTSPNQKPKLTVQQHAAIAKAEHEADLVENALFAASMAGSVKASNQVGPSGFKFYLDRLLKQAGNPTDPLERMMIEQLALAHHRISQLHVQAAEATCVDSASKYSTMAIRLTGELRRMALALKQYRQPTSPKHFTVVKQQNLSSGDQNVAYLDQASSSSAQDKVPSLPQASKQGSERLSNGHRSALTVQEEPEPCPSWQAEPEAARALDRRRA